jgi:hypothetical protein
MSGRPITVELRRIWDGGRQRPDDVFALCGRFESELREMKAEVASHLGLRTFPDDLEAAFESFAERCVRSGSVTAAYWRGEAARAKARLEQLLVNPCAGAGADTRSMVRARIDEGSTSAPGLRWEGGTA